MKTPDFQALMDLCRINEEAPRFNLSCVLDYESWCGSYGCLLGNYAIFAGRDDYAPAAVRGSINYNGRNRPCGLYEDSADLFGITEKEAMFLFCEWDRDTRQITYRPPTTASYRRRGRGEDSTRAAAIARVRKFIYYKLKKREFLYESDGRVRESARRLEGNHGFAAQAIRESRNLGGQAQRPGSLATA